MSGLTQVAMEPQSDDQPRLLHVGQSLGNEGPATKLLEASPNDL